MADFMEGMDPFVIFPEEVWDIILDEVEDPQDAWYLLKAFPQLDANTALQKKKNFWLFGLVIPHLVPSRKSGWIQEQDLLHCRQVCRKWSTAVDGFLEGQPQLRAYHPDTHGQVAQLVHGVGSSLVHWDVKPYLFAKDEDKLHFGGTSFLISDDDDIPTPPGGPPIKRFLRDMAAHPPGRSPFLSRALSIYFWAEDDDSEAADFTEDVLALHRKFGEHVWYYIVDFRWGSLGASCMIEGIRFLPNLKLLHVVVADSESPPPSDAEVRRFLEQLGNDLPALPSLETLRLEDCPQQLSHLLITRFSAQIRKLDLGIELWRDEYSRLFPNLTELVVSDWYERYEEDRIRIKDLLSSLVAPQLAKLQLKFPFSHKELQTNIEDDVFQWLKRFPNIKFLDIGHDCEFVHCSERGVLDPANNSISSLQFLAIRTSFEMNYNFLRCLPSLQHLQLYVSSKPVVIDLSTNPVVKILEEIQTASMYKSNIWELLPKLKTVTLVVDGCDWESMRWYAFSREGYDFEQRLNNGQGVDMGGDDHVLAPLRKDISEFLQEQRGRRHVMDLFWDDWDGEEEEEESDLDDWDLNVEDSSEDEFEEDDEDEDVAEAEEDDEDAEEEEDVESGDEEEDDDDDKDEDFDEGEEDDQDAEGDEEEDEAVYDDDSEEMEN